jgi:GNAT superfamily N-acetyltransferase
MISVQYSNELDKKFINEILEIDASVYPEHLQGTFEEVYGRFCANREMFVLLYDDKRLIGYLCMFPIIDSLFQEISNGDKLFDSDIPGEMLEQYKPNNVYKLYLISMVIIPEYQNKGLSKYLIKGFYHFLHEKKKENILFSVILSSAVTNDGKQMLERMGFKEKKKLPGGYSLNEFLINDSVYEIAERNCK